MWDIWKRGLYVCRGVGGVSGVSISWMDSVLRYLGSDSVFRMRRGVNPTNKNNRQTDL